jgi:hypothetical protein
MRKDVAAHDVAGEGCYSGRVQDRHGNENGQQAGMSHLGHLIRLL